MDPLLAVILDEGRTGGRFEKERIERRFPSRVKFNLHRYRLFSYLLFRFGSVLHRWEGDEKFSGTGVEASRLERKQFGWANFVS